MAAITVENDELLLTLSTREKVAGLHGDIRVPIASVHAVGVERDALAAVRGMRAPGLALPGRTKIGTWRRRASRAFVVARRDVPAVRVSLRGAGYDELLVSTEDAQAAADRIRSHAVLA